MKKDSDTDRTAFEKTLYDMIHRLPREKQDLAYVFLRALDAESRCQ